MDISNQLFNSLMGNEKERAANALAQLNTRWKLLVDIHHDLQQRFIAKVLVQLNDKDKLKLTPCIEKIETLQKNISDHIETVEARDLHQYAFCLKETAMLAMVLCKKYKVCNDIKSFNYNTTTRMIELNGEDLYFLGETKNQLKVSATALIKDKHTCTTCDSHNMVMVSELHQAETSKPTYAPPRKKFAFFSMFLTCSFLGITWYLTKASMSGGGEIPYLYMLVGLACLAYTAYAFHYNFMKFPSAKKQWESSFFCNDCGSISFAKS